MTQNGFWIARINLVDHHVNIVERRLLIGSPVFHKSKLVLSLCFGFNLN